MKWRVINSGVADAAHNMAVDEAILLAHSTHDVPPTIRFYGWRPATVSIGYFQKLTDEIDVAECENQDIDIVRRLTGGRAVLHDAELTYSIVVGADYPAIPRTITASYRYFSRGLLHGLERLGVKAEMKMPVSAYGQKTRKHTSAACFDASSQYEITYQGRKLAGSAQVRKNGIILQHGSILIRFSPEKLASVILLPSSDMRDQLTKTLANRVISLEDILGRSVSWEEVQEAMSREFGAALGVDLEVGELIPKEKEISQCLVTEKYGENNWNRMR